MNQPESREYDYVYEKNSATDLTYSNSHVWKLLFTSRLVEGLVTLEQLGRVYVVSIEMSKDTLTLIARIAKSQGIFSDFGFRFNLTELKASFDPNEPRSIADIYLEDILHFEWHRTRSSDDVCWYELPNTSPRLS